MGIKATGVEPQWDLKEHASPEQTYLHWHGMMHNLDITGPSLSLWGPKHILATDSVP